MALTKTLEQIIQDYRREHEQEKKPIIMKDNTLKRIRNSQEDTGTINVETELSIEYIKFLKKFTLIFLVYKRIINNFL